MRMNQNTGEKPAKKKRKKSSRKDKGKPKRPLSSYNLFFKLERDRFLAGKTGEKITALDVAGISVEEERDHDNQQEKKKKRPHVKTHGMLSFPDMTRFLASKWKKLSAEERSLFDRRAAALKVKWQQEMDEWYDSKISPARKMNQHDDRLTGETNRCSPPYQQYAAPPAAVSRIPYPYHVAPPPWWYFQQHRHLEQAAARSDPSSTPAFAGRKPPTAMHQQEQLKWSFGQTGYSQVHPSFASRPVVRPDSMEHQRPPEASHAARPSEGPRADIVRIQQEQKKVTGERSLPDGLKDEATETIQEEGKNVKDERELTEEQFPPTTHDEIAFRVPTQQDHDEEELKRELRNFREVEALQRTVDRLHQAEELRREVIRIAQMEAVAGPLPQLKQMCLEKAMLLAQEQQQEEASSSVSFPLKEKVSERGNRRSNET